MASLQSYEQAGTHSVDIQMLCQKQKQQTFTIPVPIDD